MGITIGCRGDNVSPRFVTSPVQTETFKLSAATPDVTSIADAGTGIIGGSVINTAGSNNRMLKIMGAGNWPIESSSGISCLMRVVPRYTGFPSSGAGLLYVNGVSNSTFLQAYHQSNGTLVFWFIGHYNNTMILHTTAATWSPTANTPYDIVFTWDGTTSSNGFKIYIDGVLLEQSTASRATDYDNPYHAEICLGAAAQIGWLGDLDYNEFVVWDSVIDPTTVTLESGSGSLNGSSRSSFVEVAASSGGSGGSSGPKKIKTSSLG